MKEQFFNTLIQTFFRMQNEEMGLAVLRSLAMENYVDWYEHYRDGVQGLPEELPDHEVFNHWKIWALNFIEGIKNNESLIVFSEGGDRSLSSSASSRQRKN